MNPEDVNDRLSFVKFVSALKGHPANSNLTLDSFLEALESYTEDVQGYYDNLDLKIDANIPSWRVFADILKGATMYE